MATPTRTRRRRPSAAKGADSSPKAAGGNAYTAKKKRSQEGAVDEAALLASVPEGLATAFVNAKLHDKAVAVAGLQPPGDWSGEMPVIPDDIASEDHDTLSNLLGKFANALSTATWRAVTHKIEHGFYIQIAEYLEAVAILNSDQSNEQKRKAEAATSEPVVVAKALVQTAHAEQLRFESMASTLKVRHATVSRVGGFVGDDAEAEDQGPAPNLSTRGKGAGKARGAERTRTRIRKRK